jgi:hypothetical protein
MDRLHLRMALQDRHRPGRAGHACASSKDSSSALCASREPKHSPSFHARQHALSAPSLGARVVSLSAPNVSHSSLHPFISRQLVLRQHHLRLPALPPLFPSPVDSSWGLLRLVTHGLHGPRFLRAPTSAHAAPVALPPSPWTPGSRVLAAQLPSLQLTLPSTHGPLTPRRSPWGLTPQHSRQSHDLSRA